jgi:hypothetical protein
VFGAAVVTGAAVVPVGRVVFGAAVAASFDPASSSSSPPQANVTMVNARTKTSLGAFVIGFPHMVVLLMPQRMRSSKIDTSFCGPYRGVLARIYGIMVKTCRHAG